MDLSLPVGSLVQYILKAREVLSENAENANRRDMESDE